MRNLKLLNQIEKAFNKKDINESLAYLIENEMPLVASDTTDFLNDYVKNWDVLVGKIQASYEKYDNQINSLARILELSTQELFDLNRDHSSLNLTLKAILNSLDDAVLLFDKNGLCSPIFSERCHDLLETDPNNKEIWDVLKLQEKQQETKLWIELLFDSQLSFEDIAPLGPSEYLHSKNKKILLSFIPLKGEGQRPLSVILLAKDKTKEFDSDRKIKHITYFNQRNFKYLSDRINYRSKVLASDQLLKRIINHQNDETQNILRNLHTLKSTLYDLSFTETADKIHNIEDLLKNEPRESIFNSLELRVSEITETFEKSFKEIQNIEQVISKSIREADSLPLVQEYLQEKEIWKRSEINEFIDNINNYVSLRGYLSGFSAKIEELSKVYQKKVAPLKIDGEAIVDKTFASDILMDLVHIFTNIIIHGIEAESERVALKKNIEGLILIKINRNNNRVCLQIEDDGQGIDLDTVKRRALQKKLVAPDESLTKEQILNILFMDGFSTVDVADQNAGRGVGLSALKQSIQRASGSIRIESERYQYTRFILDFPIR